MNLHHHINHHYLAIRYCTTYSLPWPEHPLSRHRMPAAWPAPSPPSPPPGPPAHQCPHSRATGHTMIKKNTKFFSYLKKSRRKRLQSHIWLKASSYLIIYLRISSYITKPFLIWLSNRSHLNFLMYEENFILFFINVFASIIFLLKTYFFTLLS